MIEFTDEELQALANLMDAGVKFIGLGAVTAAAHLLQKLGQDKPEEPLDT